MEGNNMSDVTWRGRPSQWVNFGWFVICGLFFWLVIPIFIALWQWLAVRNTRYELTSDRLFTYSGVLNKTVDELELYRVKDYSQSHPLLLRMVGLGNISLKTSDRTDPDVLISAIPDATEVRAMLRTNVEKCRTSRGVREIDM